MNRLTLWSLPLTSPSRKKLATVIARLDIRRAQVLVEAIIVEVQDGNGLNLGVQWANKKRWSTAIYQYRITDFLTLRKVWLIIKRMVGSPARILHWDMFSAYNGMAAGFFQWRLGRIVDCAGQ